MEYVDGFKDAVEFFEGSINKAITKEKNFTSAMNEIVSTLYVAKLKLEIMEDDLGERLEEQFNSFSNVDMAFGEMVSDIFNLDCSQCIFNNEYVDEEEF